MSDYAPLRDAFNEMNKLLIDKQQWDGKHELDKEEMGLKRMQVESQLQDAKLQRSKLEKESMMAQDAMSPTDANIYDWVPHDSYTDKAMFENSTSGQKFAELLGGSSVDRATGRVYDANGNTVRMQKALLAQRAAAAYGVVAGSLDPEEHANMKVNQISSEINSIESQLSGIPLADIGARVELKTRLADLKNQHKAAVGALEPEQLAPLYRQRTNMIDRLKLNVAAAGSDPHMLSALQDSSSKAMAAWQVMETKVIQKQENERNRELKREEAAQRSADRRQTSEDTLEAARIRAAGGPSEKSQQHLAVLRNDAGLEVASDLVNVPKVAGKSYTPESATDGKLKGYVWHAQSQDIDAKMKENKVDWGVAKSSLESYLKSENIMGQQGLAPADQARLIGAQLNFKSGTGNPMKDAARTWQGTLTAEEAFTREVDLVAAQIARAQGVPKLSAAEWNKISTKLAREKGGFFEDFMYVPQFEHRESLYRNLNKNNMRPQAGGTSFVPDNIEQY
jgi:hypothetical protein